MKKQEFLERLGKHLPPSDREERLNFYSEMIDDRMEEGLSEEEAVEAVGSVENILADTTPEKPKKQWQTWEIIFLVLGAPVWVSLLIAVIAVIFSLYVSLWAVIVSLWTVFGALFGCALSGLAATVGLLFGGHFVSAIAVFGAAMVCTGLSIAFLWGCKAVTKGTVLLTKTLLKKCFAGKENG